MNEELPDMTNLARSAQGEPLEDSRQPPPASSPDPALDDLLLRRDQAAVHHDPAELAQAEEALAAALTGSEAVAYARSAAHHYQTAMDAEGEMRALQREAQLLAGQPAEELRALQCAAEVARVSDMPAVEEQLLAQISAMLLSLGRPTEAAAAVTRALHLGTETPADPRHAGLLLALALAQHRAGQLDEARVSYHAAARESIRADQRCHMQALTGLGEVFMRQDQAQRALPFLNRASELAEEQQDPANEIRALALTAEAHALLQNPAAAETTLKRCLAMQTLNDTPQLKGQVLLQLAELHLSQGNPPAARQALTDLSDVDSAHSLPRVEQQRLWARLAEVQADHALAVEQYKRLVELQLEQLTESHRLELALGEVRHSVERYFWERTERQRAAAARTVTAQQEETSGESEKGGAKSLAYGMEQLERDFKRCLRTKSHLTVAVLGFIQDLSEDGVGDMQAMTQILRECVRDTDTIAQFERYKLLVIFPDTHGPGARQVLQRFLDRAAQRGLDHQDQLAAGVCARGFVQGARLLLDAAHEQFYRASRLAGQHISLAE
ncbi:tetratricopeptide repeat protein (plasmid) [Deinococcus taeanensis]|uniref:tetratricopeptide repeat protein n=1 Tax=Deinococcus taeanensis TaxID=2737050 RepID=UPI001CDB61F9|nr:tetratricopeptide repeat protein [Deinococcus taeanensis]UBV45388.1 tetratricopeptide repeat protein [Deinococcus taeanensis]